MKRILIAFAICGVWAVPANAQEADAPSMASVDNLEANEPDYGPPATATSNADHSVQVGEAQAWNIEERMVLPEGRFHAVVPVEIDLSDGHEGSPVSFAPDLWYGATADLSVGWIHSSYGRTGFFGGTGSGLCPSSTSGGCKDQYVNTGIEARYHLLASDLSLAVTGGIHVLDFGPFATMIKGGVIGSYRPAANWRLVFQPSVAIPLSNRGADTMEHPDNLETLFLPASFVRTLNAHVSLAVQTGAVIPIDQADDRFYVPLTLGVNVAVNRAVTLFGSFGFQSLIGGNDIDDGLNQRSATIGTAISL